MSDETSSLDDWGPWTGGQVTARNRSSGDASPVWALYQNRLFIVTAVPFQCDWGWCVHLVMRLKPGSTGKVGPVEITPLPPAAGITWAVKQRVRDELLGPERLAVEVFPPRSELVDEADAYHLWVLPEGFRLPFNVEAI